MADLYDYPDIYDERFTEGANNAYRQHYEKILAGKGINTILDCSFGTGNLSFPLAELGYQLTGSDISGAMLAKAAEKAKAKGFDIELAQCDFRERSSRFSRQFDCVMSTGSALAHVPEPDVLRVIREMDKCVAPGGWLYFDSRNWDAARKNTTRFIFPQPFYKDDGTRIGCVQMWDYNPDGTITINILHTYERPQNLPDQRLPGASAPILHRAGQSRAPAPWLRPARGETLPLVRGQTLRRYRLVLPVRQETFLTLGADSVPLSRGA